MAFGHSALVETDPPLGASLETAPETFHLIYDKPIEAQFGTFTLRNDAGETLQTPPVSLANEGRVAVIDLSGELGSGGYRLHWKAVSAGDGHVIQGVVPFAVGDHTPVASGEQLTSSASKPTLGRTLARWLELLAMLVLAGSVVVPLIDGDRDIMVREAPVLWGSLGVLLMAGSIDVAYQTQAIGSASAFDVLTQSYWGQTRLAEYALALGIGGLMLLRNRHQTIAWGARALAGVMLLAHAAGGHNAGMLGTPGLIIDWIHMAAVAMWLGGLVQLAWVWIPDRLNRSPPQRHQLMASVIPRFSQWALVSVLLLVGSGLYAAFGHIPHWGALVSTIYGQLLLAKSGLLVVALGLAAYHRLKQVPRIADRANHDPDDRPEEAQSRLGQFRKTVLAEAVILSGILLLAGGMTLISPPHASAQGPVGQPATFAHEQDGHRIHLTVHPTGSSAERRLEVAVRDADTGEPIDDVLRVWLRFEYLDRDLGDVQQKPVAESIDAGRYVVDGPYLNLEGDWTVTAIVRIEGRIEDVEAEYNLTIEDEGQVSSR